MQEREWRSIGLLRTSQKAENRESNLGEHLLSEFRRCRSELHISWGSKRKAGIFEPSRVERRGRQARKGRHLLKQLQSPLGGHASVHRGLGFLLPSMVGQGASFFAEPLVTLALADAWMGTSQWDYPLAMLAALQFFGGSHKLVHLHTRQHSCCSSRWRIRFRRSSATWCSVLCSSPCHCHRGCGAEVPPLRDRPPHKSHPTAVVNEIGPPLRCLLLSIAP